MNDEHIDPEQFADALEEYGPLFWKQAARVHVHLLRGCPECVSRVLAHHHLTSLDEILDFESPSGELQRRQNQREGEALVAWLESLPQADRLEQVANDKKLHRQLVLVALHHRVRALWSSEPQKALELAEVALAILPKKVESSSDIEEDVEVDARTWSFYGNVQRILSDLPEADRAFRRATHILKRFGGKDAIDGELWGFKASLSRARRRWQEAIEAVGKAAQIYAALELWPDVGRQLLNSAKIHCDAGKPHAALAELRRAVPLLDLAAEPRLAFTAASIELHLLCETAQYQTAQEHVPHARDLAERYAGPADLLRVRWCEGRAAAGLGDLAHAETCFAEARRGFVEQGIGYDAALVSLDLAVLYAEQGRTAETRELAQEMLAVFDSRGVRTEALAAAFLFCNAVSKEQASLEALTSLRQRIQQVKRG